jgi:hypothetical protein
MMAIDNMLDLQGVTKETAPHGLNVEDLAKSALSVMGWRLIVTAPQDDTVVDIWRGEWKYRATDMRRCDLGDGNVFYEPADSGPSCVRDATHWMPRPPAPEGDSDV